MARSQFSRKLMLRYSQAGASLIELMVGLVIGLISIAAIYQVFAVTEGQKRATGGVSEAQQAGALSSYLFSKDLFGAGAGFAPYLELFDNCQVARPKAPKPVPVVITDGDAANPKVPDSFVITQAVARMPSLLFRTTAVSGPAEPFKVVDSLIFSAGDRVLAVSGAGATTQCDMVKLSGVGAPNTIGVRDLVHDVRASGLTFPKNTALVNLGPEGIGGELRYDIVNNQLRVQDLTNPAGAPSPVLDNVVNMQVQYGVGTYDAIAKTYSLSKWVNPVVDASGVDYTSGGVQGAKADYVSAGTLALRSIIAIRIAIVTRSPQYDKDLVTGATLTLFPEPVAASGGAPIALNMTDDERHFRYRVQEIVIPMRNLLWNSTPL